MNHMRQVTSGLAQAQVQLLLGTTDRRENGVPQKNALCCSMSQKSRGC